MLGKLLGSAVSTVVRAVNLPAEAVDLVVDAAIGEAGEDDIFQVSRPGRRLAEEAERLLETIDQRRP